MGTEIVCGSCQGPEEEITFAESRLSGYRMGGREREFS